jgi:ABC-type branched-subunit amino acid transport system substrate-binding protein
MDALNAGEGIKPYDGTGFGGMKIEVDLIDEAGGATRQVEELRNAFERDHVDAVLGYISSGDCLAVAPAAEELKKFLVLMDWAHRAFLRRTNSNTSSAPPPVAPWITSPWPGISWRKG